MLTDTELAKLIVSWRNQTGTEIKGRMSVPYDTSLRMMMYRDLIETLITNHKYEEDDLLAPTTKRMILEASVEAKTPGMDTIKKMATSDWIAAVSERYEVEILTYDPSKVDTSRRNTIAPEPTPEELGPLVLSQEEFDSLTDILTKQFDKEFLVEMLVTNESKITQKQADKLAKIKIKAKNLQKLKDKEPARAAAIEEEQESVEAQAVQENPLDRSIFEGLPPVVDPNDDEFLKLIASVGGNE